MGLYLKLFVFLTVLLCLGCEKNGWIEQPVIGLETGPKGPELLFFEPDSGVAGTEVHIHGNNFSYNQENLIVMVGDSIARITRSSKNDIYFILPDLAITQKTKLKVQVYSRTAVTQNDFSFISSWSLKSSLPLSVELCYGLFTLNEKEYVITPYYKSEEELIGAVWEYDPFKDAWTRKKDFPDIGGYFEAVFTIKGKAYCGLVGGDSSKNDFWEYDPAIDFWNKIADYPGHRNFEYQGFSLGDYGYVTITGYNSGPYCELWQYDPVNNSWTQKGDHTEHLTGFMELDGIAYLNDDYGHIFNYNVAEDKFDEITYAEKTLYQAFSINRSLYYFEMDGTANNKLWRYDHSTQIWKYYPGPYIIDYMSICFSLKNKGYIVKPNSKGMMISFDPAFFYNH